MVIMIYKMVRQWIQRFPHRTLASFQDIIQHDNTNVGFSGADEIKWHYIYPLRQKMRKQRLHKTCKHFIIPERLLVTNAYFAYLCRDSARRIPMEVYHTRHRLRKTAKQSAVDGVARECWLEERKKERKKIHACIVHPLFYLSLRLVRWPSQSSSFATCCTW